MSGLAGVWNFDGQPLDPAVITAIASTVAHRGTDPAGIWFGNRIAFACHVRRVSSGSATERQPVWDSIGNALVFDGRLDNRDDLLAHLSAADIGTDAADAALVFEAFYRWSDACLERLVGDFALAFFDARHQRLVLARDAVGCRPLYYWTNGARVVFGSEIKAILAHPDVRPAPNEELLADFLSRDQLPYEDEGETFFQGVRSILPGWRLIVTSQSIKSEQFWDFDPLQQVRYATYEAYADRLRELLIQSVRRRLRTDQPVAIAASGGLDSSIVLCLAHELQKQGHCSAPLLPLTCVPSGTEPGEEQRHIELLESSRQVQVARVAMGKVGDRNDLEAVAWRAESPRFDDGWCAERPMIDAASAQGARTLLTGLWSDQIFFVTGYLTDLARRMAWRQVATHLREYPRWFVDVRFQYFVARFCRDLFFNLTPDGVRASLRPLVRSRARQPAAALVGPALAAHARRRRARIPRPRCASAHARDIYQFVRAKAHRLQFEADDKLAASCGIDSVTPFLDRDLLAFLMSIPGEIQNRDGVPRAILRDSMRGLVPDRILGRRWRDEYAALARTRQAVYLSPPAELCAARSLGFVRQTTAIGDESLEFLGLEFWSRVFFSDRLTVPQPQFDDAIRS